MTMVSIFYLSAIAMRDSQLNISRLISSAMYKYALQGFSEVSV